MNYYEVAPLKIVRAGSSVFTYQSEQRLHIGNIVSIPVGSRLLSGVVMNKVAQPKYATKPVEKLLEDSALPKHLLDLAAWLSDYYHTPLATVFQTILPRGLGVNRRQSTALPEHKAIRLRTKNVFTSEQKKAIEAIMSRPSGTSLLQGVTGSGKTEVYKEIARRTIASGRSVILLVPEISLTSQLIDEFLADFPDLIVTHSHMSDAQRHIAWRRILTATTPQLVVGPRSALFMPVAKLGAVIIDEAHEPSYKQEQAPRYSALRAASVLGKLCEARVVFGSATPLVVDRYTADANGSPVIRLDKRAKKGALAANVSLVDITKRGTGQNHRFLSKPLLENIEHNLASGHQTLLFHNRRGSAQTTLCKDCGWTALCERCFVPMVLHNDAFTLVCHICDARQKVPTSCPTCGGADIIHKGIGTKLIESELLRLFPKARVARFDSDNLADETVNARYKELYDGDIDILIGTQVIAKGLDLPKLRTVGVIQADSGLALPDFAAAERTFQLLAQVVGRVGRDQQYTTAIIQTYQPTHPIIQFGLAQDYEGAYEYLIKERRRAHFPPFRYLLVLTAVYKTEAGAIRASRALAGQLKKVAHADVEILGPTPAFYERQHGTYRWQLTLKSPRREHLSALLQHVPTAGWQSELDPTSLL